MECTLSDNSTRSEGGIKSADEVKTQNDTAVICCCFLSTLKQFSKTMKTSRGEDNVFTELMMLFCASFS